MEKRIITILLTVILLFSMFPVSAFAVEPMDQATLNADNVVIEGTNSFGTMLSNEVDQSQQEAQEEEKNYEAGYSVTDLVIEGSTAVVTYDSLENAILVVALYSEDGLKMLNSNSMEVSAEENTVEMTFEGDMPEYFLASAYLMDIYDLSPLCASYDTPMYTQEMQELLASTVDDYDEERVLNLDDDKTTNFAVYAEDTKIIDYREGMNTVAVADDENNTYVIVNADEQITGLQVGDVFAYSYAENETLILKVATIEIDEDDTTVTITSDEMEMEEVFAYLKLESESNQTNTIFNSSETDDGITYVEDETIPRALSLEDEASAKLSYTFKLDKKFKTNESDALEDQEKVEAEVEVKGSLKLNVEIELNFYIAASRQYLEFKVDTGVSLGVEVSGKIEINGWKLGSFDCSPVTGIFIHMSPQVELSFSGKIEFNVTFAFTLGFHAEHNKKGFHAKNLSTTPDVDLELEFEGVVFFGVDMHPEIIILSRSIAKAEMEDLIGVEIKGEGKHNYLDDNALTGEEVHSCEYCLDGDVSLVAQVDVKVQFLKSDKLKLDLKIVDIKIKLFDFYWSISNSKVGLGDCPNIVYRVTFQVKDADGTPVRDTEILAADGTSLGTTNSKGTAVQYLADGKYTVSTTIFGEKVERSVTVSEACLVTLQQGKNYDSIGSGITGIFGTINIENVADFMGERVELNGHKYVLLEATAIVETWEAAQDYCESLGGHLATITSQEENDFLYDYIVNCGYTNAYFGLSDVAHEGTWEWVTGEEVDYLNWNSGEPNAESRNEDYAMFYYKYRTGTWNDGNFGHGTVRDNRAFICEWDNPSKATRAIYGGDYSTEITDTYTLKKASFANLVPDEQYVLLAMKSVEVNDPLATDNLLFIDQATASEDGILEFQYVQRELTNVSYVVAFGASNKNLKDAEITFPEMTAIGEMQAVEPEVIYNDVLLTEGQDYIIVGTVDFMEAGEYDCYVRGVRNYTGLVKCIYKVKDDETEQSVLLYGDADKNGKIDEEDIVLINKYRLDETAIDYPLSEFALRVDLDRDGDVDLDDIDVVNALCLNQYTQQEGEKLFGGSKAEFSKVNYVAGETLDTADLALVISFDNGATYSITEGLTVTGFDSTLLGQQTVTVSFYQFSAEFEVTVAAEDAASDIGCATGHTEIIDVAVKATCTETGLTEGKRCSVCNVVLVAQEIVEATGHSYEVVDTAPTCIAQGYSTYSCVICSDSYIDNYVDLVDHNYGEWIVDEEATCTIHGMMHRACSYCGEMEFHPIESTGHSNVANWDTFPTCTEPGEYGETCFDCGEDIYRGIYAPLGHSFRDGICVRCDAEDDSKADFELSVSNVESSGKIRLTWEKVSGASKYKVYRATSKDGEYTRLITTSKTSMTNTSAKAGYTYYYYVEAVSKSGKEIGRSNTGIGACRLKQPSVTTSNDEETGKIRLTWKRVDGAVGYEVYRANSKNGTYALLENVEDNEFIDMSAKAGKTYYYKVKALAAVDTANSNYSDVEYHTSKLAAPAATVTIESSGKIRISWEEVDGAVKYEVYRATSKNGSYKRLSTTSNTTLLNSKNISAGKTYYYKVKAIASKSAANSDFSAVQSITSKLESPTVTVSNTSSGKIQISWVKVKNAVSYNVYRATSEDGEYKLLQNTKKTSLTNGKNVTPGTVYYYQVVAVCSNKAGNSDPSEVKTGSSKLSSPTVKISSGANGGIKLTWDTVNGAKSYQVYRSTSKNGSYTTVESVTGTSMTDTSVTAGKTYYYYVIADAENGMVSGKSNIVSRTCKLASPIVALTNEEDSGKIRISWEEVEGAVEYKVYRATSKKGTYKRLSTTSNTTLLNSKNTTVGKTYYYKVVAIGASSEVESEASKIQSITCKLPRPEAELSESAKGKPVVSWEKVSGAKKYTVYIYDADGEMLKTYTTSKTKMTHGSAEEGVAYSYQVMAVHSKSEANSSKSVLLSLEVEPVAASVIDAYSDAVFDDYLSGEILCYHIPKVDLISNREMSINAKIYDQLFDILDQEVYAFMDDEDFYPGLSEMVYSWGRKNDALSVVVQTNQNGWAWTEYYVYNISVDTGEELSVSKLVDTYGLSSDEFYSLVKETLDEYWESRESDLIPNIGEKYFKKLVDQTLEDENIKESIPYINTEGELCMIVNIYSPAGAEYYRHLFNISGGQESDLKCDIDHSAEVEAGTR